MYQIGNNKKAKNGRLMLKCTCAEHGITTVEFVKNLGNQFYLGKTGAIYLMYSK